jgi:hypothetical protein
VFLHEIHLLLKTCPIHKINPFHRLEMFHRHPRSAILSTSAPQRVRPLFATREEGQERMAGNMERMEFK